MDLELHSKVFHLIIIWLHHDAPLQSGGVVDESLGGWWNDTSTDVPHPSPTAAPRGFHDDILPLLDEFPCAPIVYDILSLTTSVGFYSFTQPPERVGGVKAV